MDHLNPSALGIFRIFLALRTQACTLDTSMRLHLLFLFYQPANQEVVKYESCY